MQNVIYLDQAKLIIPLQNLSMNTSHVAIQLSSFLGSNSLNSCTFFMQYLQYCITSYSVSMLAPQDQIDWAITQSFIIMHMESPLRQYNHKPRLVIWSEKADRSNFHAGPSTFLILNGGFMALISSWWYYSLLSTRLCGDQ